jgi:hypothetical protein
MNPKAKKLLKDLEDLKLISIDRDSKSDVKALMKSMRKHPVSVPSLDEIPAEVERVKSKMEGN